jgi:solute carrier family 25 (mitochondrial oxoglutarate transporter), member 11
MYRGVVQSIQLLAQQRGVMGLWTGFLPYYLRCGGHTVSMFVFVEYMRKMYQDMN